MVSERKNEFLKVTSLVTLTLQNAVLGLSMRYARTRTGPMFLSSTAVVMSEFVKFCTCLFLVYNEHKSIKTWAHSLRLHIIDQPMDTIKVSIPSFIYIIQNNLLYVSASHLDAATYQVTYQLKILTTAVFAVIILKKKLAPVQWLALIVLIAGVAMVQIAGSDASPTSGHQNRLIGFSAALGACVLSGLAGIYFEKILKGSDVSIWIRNVQLSFLSLPFGILTCFFSDYHTLLANGFFYGYDTFVLYLVFLQAFGGLLVAVVVKYADNILKGFATSLAIVISCFASVYLFDFELNLVFLMGSGLVISSIFLYNRPPPPDKGLRIKITQNV